MKKKLLALFLALSMLLSVLPMSVGAEAATSDKEEEIIAQIKRIYRKTLYGSGKYTLNGYCGLMTSLQLYYLGINGDDYMIFDGKDQYNAYTDMTETLGGYRVTLYPGSRYDLEEALNQVSKGGTTDVYNVLVGFQRTNTAAGSVYGHAVVIHAILDGMVYFTEGFTTSFGGWEGSPVKCSIAEFADFYGSWTTFEGIVVFGNKDYTDLCESYSADLYVRTLEPATLVSLPGGPEYETMRTAPAGERLHVTGLYRNTLEEYYYRLDDSGILAYVQAELVEPVRFNYENVILEDGNVPGDFAKGTDFEITGTVRSDTVELGSTFVTVSDMDRTPILVTSMENHGWSHVIGSKAMNAALDASYLETGRYRYQVASYTVNHYVEAGELCQRSDEIILVDSVFTVGDVPAARIMDMEPQAVPEGWVLEDGNWYFYQDGQRQTGWFAYDGIDYYLDETGAAATGWQEVNGIVRCFSNTGALRTGWLKTEQGTMYMLRNGVAVKGFQQIDNKLWYFDEAGLLCPGQWLEIDGERYLTLADGSVAQGWLEEADGYLGFRMDGRFFGRAEKEKKTEQ